MRWRADRPLPRRADRSRPAAGPGSALASTRNGWRCEAIRQEALEPFGQRRHDAGQRDRVEVLERVAVEGNQLRGHRGQLVGGRAVRVAARHEPASSSSSKRPSVIFVLPMSTASSFIAGNPTSRFRALSAVLDSPTTPARIAFERGSWSRVPSSTSTPGWSPTKGDIYNILRPLLKQTVTYNYFRGNRVESSGTGWVERIVVDHPEFSSYFTPLSICLNLDSFDYLQFDTTSEQLLTYTLVIGTERVVIEFAAAAPRDRKRAMRSGARGPAAQRRRACPRPALHPDGADDVARERPTQSPPTGPRRTRTRRVRAQSRRPDAAARRSLPYERSVLSNGLRRGHPGDAGRPFGGGRPLRRASAHDARTKRTPASRTCSSTSSSRAPGATRIPAVAERGDRGMWRRASTPATDRELTVYSAKVPAEASPRALEVVAELASSGRSCDNGTCSARSR